MHSVPFRLNFAIESFIKTLAIETRIFSQLSKLFMLHNMTQRYDKDCRIIIAVSLSQVGCKVANSKIIDQLLAN